MRSKRGTKLREFKVFIYCIFSVKLYYLTGDRATLELRKPVFVRFSLLGS